MVLCQNCCQFPVLCLAGAQADACLVIMTRFQEFSESYFLPLCFKYPAEMMQIAHLEQMICPCLSWSTESRRTDWAPILRPFSDRVKHYELAVSSPACLKHLSTLLYLSSHYGSLWHHFPTLLWSQLIIMGCRITLETNLRALSVSEFIGRPKQKDKS